MNPPLPHLLAWRTLRLGPSREVIDALVQPGASGTDLDAALADFPGVHYWVDDARTRLVLVRVIGRDTRAAWGLAVALMSATLLCTLGAGAALAGSWAPASGGVFAGAIGFFVDVVRRDWAVFLQGWPFALSLLGILLIHELGHFTAARRYAIDASLPYFLPIPPTVSPIGSLGAFIRLRTPVLDRRQLLDVGASGPIAGFVITFGVLVWGYLTSERMPILGSADPSYVLFASQPIYLGESLLTWMMREWLIPGTGAVHLSLPAFAGWVGALITGLNLLPLSQLDGGHVLYGLLGPRQATIGILTVVGLLALAQFSPMWYLWVVLTLFLGGGRWSHPSVVMPDRPLPASRRWIGWICIVVFVLTFMPIPFVPGQ